MTEEVVIERYVRQHGAIVCESCGTHTKLVHAPRHKPDCQQRQGVLGLTEREIQMALLLSEGTCVKDIAVKLDLSPKTVEAHKYNLYTKMDVHNIAQLTRVVVAELEPLMVKRAEVKALIAAHAASQEATPQVHA